jgi:hypothetical protein
MEYQLHRLALLEYVEYKPLLPSHYYIYLKIELVNNEKNSLNIILLIFA